MRGPPTESLTVALASPSDVGRADVAEAHGFYGVDLYLHVTAPDPVAPAHLHLRALPQAEGHRDVPGGDVVAELLAELHWADATARRSGVLPDPDPVDREDLEERLGEGCGSGVRPGHIGPRAVALCEKRESV
jgi:hypothetical protein